MRGGERYVRSVAWFHHVAHVVRRDADLRTANRLNPDIAPAGSSTAPQNSSLSIVGGSV
jgi:hypothetical protein